VKDLSTASNPNALAGLAQMEAALNLSVREEVLSRLGGEITLELDNLVQTQPAWRAILRVKDPDRLQASVNTLLALARLNAQPSAERELNSFILQIPSGQKKLEISYAFVDGYLVIASSHQKLMEAVQLHHNGQSLAKSRKFLGALPPSPWSQVSALFYEDPVAITALQMRRLLPGMAESFRQAMSEDSALVIGAYGEESALREVTRNEGFDPAVILVVAAVAVPNLLRARLADGASAAGLIRTANVAQVTYAATYPDRGFAPDLATLGLDPQGANRVSAQHAGLIGDELGNPACTAGTWCSKSGFRFTLTGVCKQQHCDEYVVVATPLSASTGSRSFCSTSDAVVRYKIGPPLSAPISVEECQGWLALE
jgi:hypothetical protein